MKFPALALALLLVSAGVRAQAPAKPPEAAGPKTKTQQLNDEKEELKAQYELILQKQKNKIVEMEADYNRLDLENKFAAEKVRISVKVATRFG